MDTVMSLAHRVFHPNSFHHISCVSAVFWEHESYYRKNASKSLKGKWQRLLPHGAWEHQSPLMCWTMQLFVVVVVFKEISQLLLHKESLSTHLASVAQKGTQFSKQLCPDISVVSLDVEFWMFVRIIFSNGFFNAEWMMIWWKCKQKVYITERGIWIIILCNKTEPFEEKWQIYLQTGFILCLNV